MPRRSLRERNASAIATDPTTTDTAPDAEPAQPPLTAVPDAPRTRKAPQKPQRAAQAPSGAPTGVSADKGTQTASVPSRPAAGEGRLVLWTPEEIRGRMQAEQRRTGKRYLDQVLDAIEATYEQLPDLVATSGEKAHVQGSLFERVIETEHAERRVQLTIRGVLDSQLAVIDELAATTGAGSRSALVNTALDANLPS